MRWRRAVSRVVESPSIYDLLQVAAGADVIRCQLTPLLQMTAGRTVLDVGAGTGLYAECLPPSARYLWLDHDPGKLRGYARRRAPSARAVMGDVTRIGLRDKSVDYAMCTGVAHHLDDVALRRLVRELARVTRNGLVFLDSVTGGGWPSRPLWMLDRGRFPRSEQALVAALRTCFAVERTDVCTALHRYVVAVAAPSPVVFSAASDRHAVPAMAAVAQPRLVAT